MYSSLKGDETVDGGVVVIVVERSRMGSVCEVVAGFIFRALIAVGFF